MFGQSEQPQYNPAATKPPPNAPQAANSSVLLAGLMGLQPKRNPALSTSFNAGTTGALGRRPALAKRIQIGGT